MLKFISDVGKISGLATFDSNWSKYPCNLCMCNAENLNNMNMTFEPCIVLQNMLEIVDQIERVHIPKKRILQQWSIHPIQVCMHNFIF